VSSYCGFRIRPAQVQVSTKFPAREAQFAGVCSAIAVFSRQVQNVRPAITELCSQAHPETGG
jgi:hypothetical protein